MQHYHQRRDDVMFDLCRWSEEWQKFLTTSHFHTQIDPFTSKLTKWSDHTRMLEHELQYGFRKNICMSIKNINMSFDMCTCNIQTFSQLRGKRVYYQTFFAQLNIFVCKLTICRLSSI